MTDPLDTLRKPLPMFPTDHRTGSRKLFARNMRAGSYLYLKDLQREITRLHGCLSVSVSPQAIEVPPGLSQETLDKCASDAKDSGLTLQDEIVLARLRQKYPKIETPASLHPSIRKILTIVAAHYKIPIIDILSHRRTANIVRPRMITMYLARHITPHSLPEIGRYFENRDHTTVMHSMRKITRLMETDEALADEIAILRGKLESQ